MGGGITTLRLAPLSRDLRDASSSSSCSSYRAWQAKKKEGVGAQGR